MSGYDEHLLAAAPAATREQKQESYNIDLLKNSPSGTGTSARDDSTHAPLAPSTHDHDAEAGHPTKERIDSPYSSRPTPWYRTKKWVITLVILGIVVVAAVVGGAVGGTVGHKNNKNNSSSSNPPSPSGQAGAAPDSGNAGDAPDNGNVGGASGSGPTPSSSSINAGAGIGADFAIPTNVPINVAGIVGSS